MKIEEIDFDRLMDATQTVIQLKPDVALTVEDVADIQYAFECERQHEEDAVEAYSRGYAHGVFAGGGADKARLMEQVEELQTRLAVESALNRHRGWVATPDASRPVMSEANAPIPAVQDWPDADATDAAHPAWWRGHEHTAAVFCQKVNEILDGVDDGKGVSNEPWETTRRRLLALAIPAVQSGAVATIDGEPVALPSISVDGPHRPCEHRLWLARQLLDSRMTDDEAYSTVAFSPAITDCRAPQSEPLPGGVGEAVRKVDLWIKCGMPDQSDNTATRTALKRDLQTILAALSGKEQSNG